MKALHQMALVMVGMNGGMIFASFVTGFVNWPSIAALISSFALGWATAEVNTAHKNSEG